MRGLASMGLRDIYYLSMTTNWGWFYAGVFLIYLVLNTIFASLYWLEPGGIANLTPEGWWGDFFFSVETLSTVGYGDMHPVAVYTHLVAMVEAVVSIISIALITGLTFARFSRPRAQIVVAQNPVVCRYNGKLALMIRCANARRSTIAQASAKLYVLLPQKSMEGQQMRRFFALNLERNENPLFFLSWTLIHMIDESSPLWGMDEQALTEQATNLILTLQGYDEITAQDMYSRHIYSAADVRWGYEFEDMLNIDDQGREFVDYAHIHKIRKQVI